MILNFTIAIGRTCRPVAEPRLDVASKPELTTSIRHVPDRPAPLKRQVLRMDQRPSQVGAVGIALNSRTAACALHNRVRFICAVKCERVRPLEAAHLSAAKKSWMEIK
jgi:hypothetical protein